MENVYVIKVKTKPALSSLYPSERRYSASTVGGLSFVHFGLGALSLLLGSLALSLQGPILSVACLVPFVTGLLAWRRWYIDRNIAIFFYGCLFSLTAAVLCFIATMFDIAAAAESRGSLWSFGKMLDQPRDHSHLVEHLRNDTILNDVATSLDEDNFNLSGTYDHSSSTHSYSPMPGIVFDNMSNISGYILRTSTINPEGDERIESSQNLLANSDDRDEGDVQGDSSENVTEKSLETIKSRMMSFWYRDHRQSSHTKILLTVNVLVASLLEIFWSALSARIALRGMMNRLPESSYVNGTTGNVKLDEVAMGKRKPPAPRPDILDHDRRLSESLQNLTALHGLRNSGPRLPLPESSREFRERVERFLANQAAHRIVEGSCS
ncbi:unnamed protein product [Heterotrigona itama]|uniref:Uncharacterized protein n=1 Tax=Heterotrigona itama TaxID=395501 RepID=A0A6V7HGD2_9HYME|nr:unnamed protein product [Heterotrigona itama]